MSAASANPKALVAKARTVAAPVLQHSSRLLLAPLLQVRLGKVEPQTQRRLLRLQDLQDVIFVVWQRVQRHSDAELRVAHRDDDLARGHGNRGPGRLDERCSERMLVALPPRRAVAAYAWA